MWSDVREQFSLSSRPSASRAVLSDWKSSLERSNHIRVQLKANPAHWYRWLDDREFQRCRLNGHRLGAAGCIEEGLRASLNQLLLLTLPAACGAGAPLNKEHPAWLPWTPCLSWPSWPPSWPPSWLSTSLPSRCLLCSECPAYICLSARVLCDYCGCPPARHVISFVLIIPKL